MSLTTFLWIQSIASILVGLVGIAISHHAEAFQTRWAQGHDKLNEGEADWAVMIRVSPRTLNTLQGIYRRRGFCRGLFFEGLLLLGLLFLQYFEVV